MAVLGVLLMVVGAVVLLKAKTLTSAYVASQAWNASQELWPFSASDSDLPEFMVRVSISALGAVLAIAGFYFTKAAFV